MHLRAIPLSPPPMYQGKPILASLFHPYLCMADLTFRAFRIHHNIFCSLSRYEWQPTALEGPRSWKWVWFRLEAAELLIIFACNAHTSDQTHLQY